MFIKSAAFYDAIYSSKDYEAEARWIDELITARLGIGEGRSILDVACGTGSHIAHLKAKYQIEGIDLERALLTIAKQRNPGIELNYGDMGTFDLGRQFDVVMCLFSSIGYVRTVPRLQRTLLNFAKHAAPGGLVIVEPWLTPDKFTDRYISCDLVDQPEMKIARMAFSRHLGNQSATEFNYLIATPKGIQHIEELHELGLFEDKQYQEAFIQAGFKVERLEEGLMGRGVYVGSRA